MKLLLLIFVLAVHPQHRYYGHIFLDRPEHDSWRQTWQMETTQWRI